MPRAGADARVHRCAGCGAWCYGSKPCTTCAVGLLGWSVLVGVFGAVLVALWFR